MTSGCTRGSRRRSSSRCRGCGREWLRPVGRRSHLAALHLPAFCVFRDANAGNQHLSAAAADHGGRSARIERGRHFDDLGFPGDFCPRTIDRRAIIGPVRPTHTDAGRALHFRGRYDLVAFAGGLSNLLVRRSIQASGACTATVLSRAIARDLFDGQALARAMALTTIATAAAPGFSPLVGSALDHFFGWRSELVFVAVFAGCALLAYATLIGET